MEEQLKQLREELEAMRDQFTLKTMLLTTKVEALERELLLRDVQVPIDSVANTTAHTSSQVPESGNSSIRNESIAHLKAEVPPNIAVEPASSAFTASDAVFDDVDGHNEEQTFSSASTATPKKPQKPNLITIFFTHLMSLIFEWFSPVTEIYESYKARGMLGIFFLTVAGAGLVLAGFGYLMQLLIDEIGAGSKSLLMSATALAVIGGGIILQVKTKFSEFASAIVALGLLLCFSTIYFVGSVYQLIPGIAVLTLYAFTALTCHYLALWLYTKVIAVLGIVGITVMPLLTSSTIIEPTYYVLALLFVCASSLYLAYKHIGHWLADLTFAFTFIALGWVNSANALFMSAWMINAFYILFSSYLYLSLFHHKPQTKRLLILLTAMVGGSLFLLLQGTYYSVSTLNVQLIINAIISLAASLLFYKVKHEHLSVLVLITATWIVLSIVGMLAAAYWGLAWAVEALLLIFMSRHYKLPSLIHQGQGLAALAIVYCLFAVIPYFPLPALVNVDGWVIVIMIAIVISIWQRLIKPPMSSQSNSVSFSPYVHRQVYPVLVFLESAWLSIVVLASAYIWLGEWAGLSAIFIQLALLFRAKNLRSTQSSKTSLEIFAVALIVFPIAYAYMGSDAVNSMRFSQLPLYAKISLVTAFIQLWLWSAFYRKFNPESLLRNIAEIARIIFYLILPICWLSTAFRHLNQDILMVLWLSPAIALILAHLTKAKALLNESKILFAALSIVSLPLMLESSFTTSSIGLTGYVIVVTLAYFLNKTKQSENTFNFVLNGAINVTGFMLAIICALQFDSLAPAIIIISIYSLIVIGFHQRYELCKENKGFHFSYLIMASFASWALMFISTVFTSNGSIVYAIAPVIILLVSFLLNKRKMLPVSEKLSASTMPIELHMHTYLLVTYVLSCLALHKFGLDLAIAPLLAIHGATILFLKNRTKTTVRYSFALILLGITKLALIDTANVVLWQKVMLFIGIGVFILLASFWYQKLVSKDAEAIAAGQV
ncbi:MAG: hypothetical protein ACJAVV_000842 [Alphaproteobacteria bacterium]